MQQPRNSSRMRSNRGIYEQDEGVSLDLAILWSAVLFSRLDRASDNLFPPGVP